MGAIRCLLLILFLSSAASAAEAQLGAPSSPRGPLWDPVQSQMQQWVTEGVQAAARDKALGDIEGVSRWVWANRGGLRISDSQTIRFALVLTPQLIATAAGYHAAWDEETWERLDKDWGRVIAEIADGVLREITGSDLWFVLGVIGEVRRGPSAALWWGGWSRLSDLKRRGMLDSFLQGDEKATSTDAAWAARYVLSQCAGNAALQPADGITVMVGQIFDGRASDRRRGLARVVGDQLTLDPSFMRFFIGSAAQWVYLDFRTR